MFGGIDKNGNYIKNKMLVLKIIGGQPVWQELSTVGKKVLREGERSIDRERSIILYCVVD